MRGGLTEFPASTRRRRTRTKETHRAAAKALAEKAQHVNQEFIAAQKALPATPLGKHPGRGGRGARGGKLNRKPSVQGLVRLGRDHFTIRGVV